MSDVNIRVNIVSKGARRSVKALERNTRDLERGFKGVNVAIKNSITALTVFAGDVAARAFISLKNSLVSTVVGFTDATISVEKLGTQLEVLTGSTGAANALLDEIKEFSARTPFRLEGLTEAANQLLAFGFEADTIVPRLQQIGDVAAASGSDLKEVALIYGQVAAAGKLTGERLLQLQERAIPIGPALAQTLGVAESAVKNLVSEGAVDLATFEEAFASLSAEGGAAFGGIAKQAATLSGRISTLQDNFFLLQQDIGDTLAPALKAVTSALTTFIQNLRDSAAFQSFLTNAAQKIPEALQVVGFAIDIATRAFTKFKQGLEVISIASSLFFAGIAQAVIDLLSPLTTLNGALEELFGISSSTLTKSINQLKGFRDAAVKGANESIVAIKKLQAQQEKTSEKIALNTGKVITAYNSEAMAAENRTNSVLDSEKKKVEELAGLTEEELKLRKDIEDRKKQIQAQIDEEEANARLIKSDEDLQFIAEQLGAEEALKVAARQRELEALGFDKRAKLELNDSLIKALAKQRDKDLSDQKAARKAQEDLDRKSTNTRISIAQNFGNLINAVAGKQTKAGFLIQKAAAAANVIVSGLQAQAAALAPPPLGLGPVAGAGLASLIKANTAIQLGTIAATAIQGFQSGGIVPGNSLTGDRVPAALNSGEVVLNRSQQAELFGLANGNRSANQQSQEIVVNTVVELDSEVVARAVSRQVADGFELGEVV